MTKFKFELDDKVELALSGECGVVHGRAEYATSDPSYQIAYLAGDGRQVMDWWDGGLLRKASGLGALEHKDIFPEGQRTMAVIAAGTKGAKIDRTADVDADEPEADDSAKEPAKPTTKKRRTKAQIALDKAAEKAAAEAAAKAAAEVEEEDEDFSGEEDEACESEAEDEGLEDWETEDDVGAEEQADVSEAELQEAFMLASRADPANKPKLKKLVASFKVTRIGEMNQEQRNAAYAKLESGKF